MRQGHRCDVVTRREVADQLVVTTDNRNSRRACRVLIEGRGLCLNVEGFVGLVVRGIGRRRRPRPLGGVSARRRYERPVRCARFRDRRTGKTARDRQDENCSPNPFHGPPVPTHSCVRHSPNRPLSGLCTIRRSSVGFLSLLTLRRRRGSSELPLASCSRDGSHQPTFARCSR